MDLEVLKKLPWHHKWEIVPGFVTSGGYDVEAMWRRLQLPPLAGKRVADVGASNGYFSFRCKREGSDVTAFDYRHKNISGFAIAEKLTGVEIPHVQANVLELGPEHRGFDIVLFLGVLYHVADPYRALVNVLRMGRTIYIESYMAKNAPPGTVKFLGADNEMKDASCFWGFSMSALAAMVEDIGARIVRREAWQDRALIVADSSSPSPLSRHRIDLAYGTLGDANSRLTVS